MANSGKMVRFVAFWCEGLWVFQFCIWKDKLISSSSWFWFLYENGNEKEELRFRRSQENIHQKMLAWLYQVYGYYSVSAGAMLSTKDQSPH